MAHGDWAECKESMSKTFRTVTAEHANAQFYQGYEAEGKLDKYKMQEMLYKVIYAECFSTFKGLAQGYDLLPRNSSV